jgi:hypothetical protein
MKAKTGFFITDKKEPINTQIVINRIRVINDDGGSTHL